MTEFDQIFLSYFRLDFFYFFVLLLFVLFQNNRKLLEARFVMSSWMAFKWISTSSRFRNSSGYVFF